MDRATKCCELRVHLKNGQLAVGQFHVSAGVSGGVRPSDALMEKLNGLLLMSEVTIYETAGPRFIDAVMIPFDSVAYIELATSWTSRPASGPSAGVAAGIQQAMPSALPPSASRPSASKWLVGSPAGPPSSK